MPNEIWPRFGSSIELFIDDFAGGDTAVFTSCRDWFDKFRSAFPQAHTFTPSEWQQLFDDAEKLTKQYLHTS